MKEKLLKRSVKKRYILLGSFFVLALIVTIIYAKRNQILPATAYFLLQEVPVPTNQDRILVISPHPDDETLGAGGFMKRAHDAGAKVSVVIATDGNKHGLKEIRRQETVAALGVLGIPQTDIRFLDYPDGHLQAHKAELSANIKTIVSDTKPTIILGTHPADTHPDHAVVGRVLDDLVPQLQPRPLIYEFLVHYHRYPRPEGYHPSDYLLPPAKLLLATTPWQKFVLAPADQSAKYKAVLAYKSQLSRKNPLLRGLLFSFIRQNELFVINR